MGMFLFPNSNLRVVIIKPLAIPYVEAFHLNMTRVFANTFLTAKENRRATDETLYLTSISSMTTSIKKGMKEPVSKCAEDIDL